MFATPAGRDAGARRASAVGVGSANRHDRDVGSSRGQQQQRQSRIDVRFRPEVSILRFMSNVEYLPIRTSDGSLVLRVVVFTGPAALRRFLKL